jgi:hypothetical protein
MFHLFFLGQKIRRVEDKACLFCAEQESVHHLFYECVVAKKKAWEIISGIFGFSIGYSFESMARCWLCNKKTMELSIFLLQQCARPCGS